MAGATGLNCAAEIRDLRRSGHSRVAVAVVEGDFDGLLLVVADEGHVGLIAGTEAGYLLLKL